MAALCRFAPRTWASRLQQRTFHSYENTRPLQSSSTVEDAILSAAYRHVPKHGFSHRSLNQGARDAGYLDISSSVLSDGVFSLIRFHLVRQRLSLAQKCQTMFETNDKNISNGATGTKIADIIWARLLANKNVIHKWQDALAVMAQPSYVTLSMKELALLSDEIWYLAGDKSVDFSWYPKRASLSIVYSTSELFMTNDKSPGFVDTHNFMSRRLDEATTMGGLIGSISTWTNFTAYASVNVLRSKGAKL
ncbi:hypothetical protein C2857_002986 [Epichloe festucae Fl1]|uniref:Ubiquinone biosynthesis protein n=1 Tax=Epichloe festucae (strain Fl1) TaxID=877507 RepID=A0A7S9PRZ7_EPIFF|nr:hypothetical protein C2857_002986 [Epichloe festucae Fl1]